MRPHNSFSGNICFELSVLCHCSLAGEERFRSESGREEEGEKCFESDREVHKCMYQQGKESFDSQLTVGGKK
jgi:hypothetical protein